MQSMFRLSWSTESPGDKIMEKAALHKPKPMPICEMPNYLSKIKRKRVDSPEPAVSQHAQVVKKWKSAQGEMRPVVAANGAANSVNGVVSESANSVEPQDVAKVASAEVLESRAKAQPTKKEGVCKSRVPKSQRPVIKIESVNTPTASVESNLTSVQQAIEAQINYEVLLKHNELRLIEQELAKCQISLEQLRRCSIIPFPGTEGLSQDLSLGVGSSLQTPSGYTEPQYAAPWGVADGPYTRHYAKWLISDIKFDPMSERALTQQAQGYFGTGEGRTTRGSFADYGSASKGRMSRTSTGMLKIPPLGETPAPAPKVDPLLHKRSTDGQWVRLYCAQCGHSNFSNTQGFLNHCRIKHSQVFKSHDQAAIACGIPVDINEAGNPVTATEPTGSPVATPTVVFPVPTAPGIVHPLASQPAPPPQAKDVHRDFNKSPCDEPTPATPASFTKSSSTPYMSALLEKRGFTGDLKALVESARSKVDLDAIEPSDDEHAENTAASTPIVSGPTQLARLPASTPNAAPASKAPLSRLGSKKGNAHMQARLPLSFPSSVSFEDSHDMPDSPVDLSPNTVDSNPGLVSDHDDDDDEDGDDTHSQPDLIMNDDVVVEDASDVEGVQERTGSRQRLDGCFEKGEGSRKH
ncbi:hypothetical protein P153DRAFT_295593 [Dothidotthia symphoricarpi CBS 119687]|uniref:AHC1-like C2H2 zinc-finger domain-containing protein n=1 Tax=Dothidotthia symphoricarpi CBS 119687 TaxID=1392245 RepID=A0A6A6A8R7_9PLEO|nr:uncharacterized protein P153DRAFT_295593 [Dothidotthia symphoricarpi CBS 119687]KAF2127208.1 hypothetical protein P153DRAFT_295593 [Dothidotthia symphoricarpi CBS 119687]